MKFKYITLDKNNHTKEHIYEEIYNPDEICYMLDTLEIYYVILDDEEE